VFRRRPNRTAFDAEALNDLIRMMMQIDWKLDLILE